MRKLEVPQQGSVARVGSGLHRWQLVAADFAAAAVLPVLAQSSLSAPEAVPFRPLRV